jgi:hypothetical protein
MKKVIIIPVAVLLLILAAYVTSGAYRVPTFEMQFVDKRPAVVKTVEYEVAGLKCRGTSMGFGRMIGSTPGVVSLTTYARTHTAIVEYDPELITPDEITRLFESPIVHQGQEYRIFEELGRKLK